MRIRCLWLCAAALAAAGAASAGEVAIAVHGGAGAMPRAELTQAHEAEIRAALRQALEAGHAILTRGGSSLDAVTAAVVILEDSPHFNAGKGAVFNAEGRNELDAAVMDGHSARAGAVAALHRVRNPIRLARAVMEQSPHVMLIGDGAEAFARSVDVELVDPEYFWTERRWNELERARAKEQGQPQAALAPSAYFGTVGAVALDRRGHLAAATSTGGRTNKRWGRVGDSPIIGAGTYAGDDCAVSATGWGEFFIRAVVAYDICARMRYGRQRLARAAREVVMDVVPGLGGDGGVIALDGAGHVAMPFNTEGMYRGAIGRDGKLRIAIYRD
jgi:beta-aspartyl-peptidase (threonine type)